MGIGPRIGFRAVPRDWASVKGKFTSKVGLGLEGGARSGAKLQAGVRAGMRDLGRIRTECHDVHCELHIRQGG